MAIIVIEGSNGVGKTTIINELYKRLKIFPKKSVPDWFRQYIPIARTYSPEIQKEIYKIGHEAIYFESQDNQNYIFDRFIYSTIIRLNYELKKSINETVEEILAYPLIPDIVILLRSDKKMLLKDY